MSDRQAVSAVFIDICLSLFIFSTTSWTEQEREEDRDKERWGEERKGEEFL